MGSSATLLNLNPWSMSSAPVDYSAERVLGASVELTLNSFCKVIADTCTAYPIHHRCCQGNLAAEMPSEKRAKIQEKCR